MAKKKEPLSPWGSTLVPKVGQTQLPFDDAVVECGAKRAQFPTNKKKKSLSFLLGNPDHRHHHHHYHQQQQHQQQQQQLLLEDRIHPNGDLIGLSHSHTLPHNLSHHLKGK